MSNRRFILFSAALFLLGALPFLIIQPTAAASAGLSLGFSAPFEDWGVLLLVIAAGLGSALLPREGLILVALAFTMMVMVGGMLVLNPQQFPSARYFVLGAILCLTLLVGVTRQKYTLLALLVVASIGFHLGGVYLASIPTIATPMYYLLGVLLALGVIMAISIAFGVTLFGDHEPTWYKIANSPRMAFLRKLFQ